MAGPSANETFAAERFKSLRELLGKRPRIVLVVAPYYKDVTDMLVAGATEVLSVADPEITRFDVPGALELPQALRLCVEGNLGNTMIDLEEELDAAEDDEELDIMDALGSAQHALFDGAIAIGCVIRGETSHYDVVVNEANAGLYHVTRDPGIVLGNALLTVDTYEQAVARAKGGAEGKGGDAARAVLQLIKIGAEINARGPGGSRLL
ncbi:MAG: 6,7-dimethyl-8-ribityllumazine synthase [Pseudomonadota bacterium]